MTAGANTVRGDHLYTHQAQQYRWYFYCGYESTKSDDPLKNGYETIQSYFILVLGCLSVYNNDPVHIQHLKEFSLMDT